MMEMVALDDHIEEVVVLDDQFEEVVVLDVLDRACVYIHSFVLKQKRTPKQSRLVCSKRCRGRWWQKARFFFLSWKESLKGAAGPIFFSLPVFHFLSYLLPTL